MNTTLIAVIIALLASLPAGTKLDFHGEIMSPQAIIRELKSMEQEVKKEEVKKEVPVQPQAPKKGGVKAPPMRPASA